MSRASWRGCYLSLMGAVYFCAFATFYLQYPGLLGADGLLPAGKFWETIRGSRQAQLRLNEPLRLDLDVLLAWWTRGVAQGQVRAPAFEVAGAGQAASLRGFLAFPTWLWFLGDGSAAALHVDQALEGTALLGAAVAMLAVMGLHHAFVFMLLYVAYLALYLLGQRWLAFQWDIFLLEAGALTVLYCPVFSLTADGAVPPVAWLLRALVAKFMYMNGVVKVTANCPTWKELTALEYHFASTCLPTAEAWTMHQLPPFVLRLGVAAMFVIELVLPWALVCPLLAVRRMGVAAQAALQVGIMVTGNYNWFNAHTMVLLLPAWEDDDYGDAGGKGPLVCRLFTALPRFWGLFWARRIGLAAAAAVVFGLLAWASDLMFEVRKLATGEVVRVQDAILQLPGGLRAFWEVLLEDRYSITSRYGAAEVERLSAALLSTRCVHLFFVLVLASSLRYALAPLCTGRPFGATLRAVVSRCGPLVLVPPFLAVCLLPFESIHRGISTAVPFAEAARPLYHALAQWQVSSSYGLFRRMTGVGAAPRGAAGARQIGWGGLPPSVVAVPAVVLEASEDGEVWAEVPFRYALGRTDKQPRRTAPHQPRLDWQMWFAALGSYQHNHWFVHLLYKLLQGSDAVTSLLDVEEWPLARSQDPPKILRAWLYHYDFTRLDTPWARQVPGARLLNVSHASDRNEWWTRTKAREYVPAVTTSQLQDVAKAHGWPRGKKAREGALRRARNCTAAHGRAPAWGAWCQSVVAARDFVAPLARRTGWTFRTTIFRAMWPGASDSVFIDVHLAVITGPLVLGFALRFGLDSLCDRGRRRTRAAPADNKLKED